MMASPPVISAPTLVTSTNPVTSSPQNSLRDTNNADDNWHFKYLEAKGNYRKLKAQFREQANKSRQLIVVVKHKLQEEENEKIKVTYHPYWAFCKLYPLKANSETPVYFYNLAH